jgi:hypothetical protein
MALTDSFEILGDIYSAQYHIPEDMNPQKPCCENLKSCMDISFVYWSPDLNNCCFLCSV